MRTLDLQVSALFRCLLVLAILPLAARAATRGSDQVYRCPTMDQALEMAAETGKPIFLMFYANVGEGCETYTGKGTVL